MSYETLPKLNSHHINYFFRSVEERIEKTNLILSVTPNYPSTSRLLRVVKAVPHTGHFLFYTKRTFKYSHWLVKLECSPNRRHACRGTSTLDPNHYNNKWLPYDPIIPPTARIITEYFQKERPEKLLLLKSKVSHSLSYLKSKK